MASLIFGNSPTTLFILLPTEIRWNCGFIYFSWDYHLISIYNKILLITFSFQQITCGINLKYNYFIKGDAWPSYNIIWKPGPEFSLSVPIHGKRDREIMVRDLWMRCNARNPSAHTWGSWIEDSYFSAEQLISPSSRGNISVMAFFYMQLPLLLCC